MMNPLSDTDRAKIEDLVAKAAHVTDISQVEPGQLLHEDGSRTMSGTPNVMRVLRWRNAPDGSESRDGFYAVFVNALDPTCLRCPMDREFHVWDFDVAEGRHRIVAAAPVAA